MQISVNMSRPICESDGKRILDHWLRKTCDKVLICKIASDSPYLKSRIPFSDQLLFNLGDVKNEAIIFDIAVLEKVACSSDPSERAELSAHMGDVFDKAESRSPWLKATKLVCKVDQGIKARGKQGLVCLNKDWDDIKSWITDLSSKKMTIGKTVGIVSSFIVEPMLPHDQKDEYYISITEDRHSDFILFNTHGGVDVGDVDENSYKYEVPVDANFSLDDESMKITLFKDIKSRNVVAALSDFVRRLHFLFEFLSFSMLEINPLVVSEETLRDGTVKVNINVLDLAAKLDNAAFFERSKYWAAALGGTWREGLPEIPSSIPHLNPNTFGKSYFKEEAYIHELDSKTGASLKLIILNPNGRIWTLVAGGGASVAYTDAIASLGFVKDLANYGEYSGAPTETQTYEYSKTIFELMTLTPKHPDGKILFIGGGIANFTNVATTFKGISNAISDYHRMLKAHNVRIYVRRAGPNYQEGLKLMRSLGETLNLNISVFGPETPMTEIVPMALTSNAPKLDKKGLDAPPSTPISNHSTVETQHSAEYSLDNKICPSSNTRTFSSTTRAIVYGMQLRAVQGMLDFDYMCKRETPSVACIVYPFGGHYFQKFYWGTREMLIPVFTKLEEACKKFQDIDVIINFSSFRSVYSSTVQMLQIPQIKVICIIAEGVPDKHSRWIVSEAKKKNVLVIGPATVGGIRPGCFKIGNTGGMMDNIIASKLYRPGSISYVSKSGGMSNELNNIICINADGVREGVAIGGDRYPGSTFIDHILRYESDPDCKMIVLLGEVGGVEEHTVAEAIKNRTVTKPVIAWCIGTCASLFNTSIQFGHAGSLANTVMESSNFKNAALKHAGAIVPSSFEELPYVINKIYSDLLKSKVVSKIEEPEVPKIPIDYAWAQELGLIRKPASFISTICDDRGEELLYAGVTITDILKYNIGLGGVLSLLWFKRNLPKYATDFIEMILVITADHGPAVSGAHNTIVTARAGKDLISSLVSGLLTIGERFGGALDGAARDFSAAYDQGLSPADFVDKMRKESRLILGIGHKVKSLNNPDHRVKLIKEYVSNHFPFHNLFNYALEVEKITTSKKDNLILNVDGAIGAAFVDVLRSCGAFNAEEADEYVRMGTLNGLFVLGRSIGFIGHYLDQKRLKQGLYRHPWDDISYIDPEVASGPNKSRRTLAESSIVVARGTGTQ